MRLLLALLALTTSSSTVPGNGEAPDVVVLILDDVGYDDLEALPTPNLDALAASGVKFTRAYSHAWCSPTRTGLMLGQTAPRWIGFSCREQGFSVRAGTPSVAQLVNLAGFTSVHVGKWHMGANTINQDWTATPHALGFAHTRAHVPTITPLAGCDLFGTNTRADDGVVTEDPTHNTIRERDALIGAYLEAKAKGERFFATVGFDDAHSPWEMPPMEILPGSYAPPLNPTLRDAYEAEILALDFVIGEILQVLGPNTWIWVIGDNGTPNQVTPAVHKGKSKLTVFERGIRVPLIVSGPMIRQGVESDALVHVATDFIPTLAAGLGVKASWAEGVSYADVLCGKGTGARDWLYVLRSTTRQQAVVERRWKLHYDERDGSEVFYDLDVDPLEENPLRPFQVPRSDRRRLRAELAEAQSP